MKISKFRKLSNFRKIKEFWTIMISKETNDLLMLIAERRFKRFKKLINKIYFLKRLKLTFGICQKNRNALTIYIIFFQKKKLIFARINFREATKWKYFAIWKFQKKIRTSQTLSGQNGYVFEEVLCQVLQCLSPEPRGNTKYINLKKNRSKDKTKWVRNVNTTHTFSKAKRIIICIS